MKTHRAQNARNLGRSGVPSVGAWQLDVALPLASRTFVAQISDTRDLPDREAWQASTEAFATTFPDDALELDTILMRSTGQPAAEVCETLKVAGATLHTSLDRVATG